MSAAMFHYVCDRCGHYWRANDDETCPECGHDAVWEFPPARSDEARQHARHVKRGHDSGLFREARS